MHSDGICSSIKLCSGLGLRSRLSGNFSRHSNTALLTEAITDVIITAAKHTLQH